VVQIPEDWIYTPLSKGKVMLVINQATDYGGVDGYIVHQ